MALPRAVDALKNLAIDHGVCIRPVSLRRTDLTTGATELIDLPCGATLEAKCPPCAKRARHYRQVQIREGWHRTDEPVPPPAPATDDQKALISLRADFEFYRAQAERAAEWDQVAELDEAITEVRKPSPPKDSAAASHPHTTPPTPTTTRATPTSPAGSAPPAAAKTSSTYPGRRSNRAPSAVPTSAATAAPTSHRCG
jgi:hypothetical protein